MQQVEDRWSDAITKRDQYGLELVLAPQFIGISASGDVTTRNQQIAHLFVKGEGPESLEQKVVSVRFVGEVAIVNGTYVMTWKTDKGPVLEKGIFSHVFEHVRTNWLCLNSQRTVVAETTKQVPPRKSPKQSAAMPSCRCTFPWSTRAQTAPSPRRRQAPVSLPSSSARQPVRYSSPAMRTWMFLLLTVPAFSSLAAFAAEKMTAPQLISLAQSHSASPGGWHQRHLQPERIAGGHGVGRPGP